MEKDWAIKAALLHDLLSLSIFSGFPYIRCNLYAAWLPPERRLPVRVAVPGVFASVGLIGGVSEARSMAL